MERYGGGWTASWGDLSSNTGQLTVEYEDEAFMVFAFLPYTETKKAEYEFWYHFGKAGSGTPEEKVNSWDDLEKALDSARNWLLTHKEDLKEDRLRSLRKLFNLKDKED